ncbi:MAG TPA: NAD(P)-dependent oxidoreductase [Egibacteraceae bacterium]|nr:NAD(P)-dependent oxidoreductase [Egibacteraceae bacterium]
MTTPAVPLLVEVAGRRVVAVGAGAVAEAKLGPLRDAGAEVVVVAPDAVPGIKDDAAAGRLTWHRRSYAAGDLAGALLVLAATADPATNERIAADAAAQQTLCVRTDHAPDTDHPGTAAFLGAVTRGDLLIAVSTRGRAPAVARYLRAELEDTYGPEYGELVALLGDLRRTPQFRNHLDRLDGPRRRAAWRSLPMADILKLLRNGDPQSARELASACLCSSWD